MIVLNSKYIIRLDDACHQMPLEKWEIFEAFFEKKNIKPIVGVVPLNKDKSLGSQFNENFWQLIKKWENKGWSIAMHGLHHQFHKIKPKNSFFNFGNKSEFVGKSVDNQIEIVQKSIQCFKENNIEPKIFMAPSHTFDLLLMGSVFVLSKKITLHSFHSNYGLLEKCHLDSIQFVYIRPL